MPDGDDQRGPGLRHRPLERTGGGEERFGPGTEPLGERPEVLGAAGLSDGRHGLSEGPIGGSATGERCPVDIEMGRHVGQLALPTIGR